MSHRIISYFTSVLYDNFGGTLVEVQKPEGNCMSSCYPIISYCEFVKSLLESVHNGIVSHFLKEEKNEKKN